MKISLACIDLNKRVKWNLFSAIKKGEIAQGGFIKAFEDNFKKWLGVRYAVFVGNGTVGDAMAMAAISEGEWRDEVIVPAFTFVAHINAIVQAGLTPVFADIDERGQLDPDKTRLAVTDRTLAIFPAHLLGRPAQIDRLKLIA